MERGTWRVRVESVDRWHVSPGCADTWAGVNVPALSWPGEYRILERFETKRIELQPDQMECPPDDSGEPYVVERKEWKTWMADSAVEIATQADCIRRLRGKVLIGGLGLGVLVKAALGRRDVDAVDVLEIDSDIVGMVGPHYRDPRVRIITADALEFKPRAKRWYDVVYMDIWRNVGACNLIDMITLRRRWVDRCGWYGAWSEDRAIAQLQRQEWSDNLSPDNRKFALEQLRRAS